MLKNGAEDHILTADDQRKGGIASGEARRAKKTVRMILNDVLEQNARSYPAVQKAAKSMGITDATSMKQAFIVASLLNSMKSGGIGELEKLQELLGEQSNERNDGILTELAAALRGEDGANGG